MRLVLDEPKENDDKYEVDGLTYLIDKELSTQSGDVKVDFVDNGWQQGFVLSTAHPLGSGGSSCGSTSCSC
jgi:Fe-S cluster assembly iron-binding protein IscA